MSKLPRKQHTKTGNSKMDIVMIDRIRLKILKEGPANGNSLGTMAQRKFE